MVGETKSVKAFAMSTRHAPRCSYPGWLSETVVLEKSLSKAAAHTTNKTNGDTKVGSMTLRRYHEPEAKETQAMRQLNLASANAECTRVSAAGLR